MEELLFAWLYNSCSLLRPDSTPWQRQLEVKSSFPPVTLATTQHILSTRRHQNRMAPNDIVLTPETEEAAEALKQVGSCLPKQTVPLRLTQGL
jgi:hypothetical protein